MKEEDFLILPDELRQKGVDLTPFGISGYAWGREDTVDVIRFFRGKQYAILGGDVVIRRNRNIAYSYDNWYPDYSNKQDYQNYIRLSAERAIDYVQKYAESYEATTYYSISVCRFPNFLLLK